MKKTLLSLCLAVSSLALMANANDPVIMTVNGKNVYLSEFEYIYNKNNNEQSIDKKSLDEYMDLFKNFKLKVAEAEAQGLDTTAVFHKELKDYRDQLAKTYKPELEVEESILRGMYDRGMSYYDLSVLWIPFSKLMENPGQAIMLLPSDTVAAYKQAMAVRAKAMKKGANFGKLVKEYSAVGASDQRAEPGREGWIMALALVPELEQAITSTPVGSVTMPVRVPQGYYLMKVHNIVENPGSAEASHILVMCPEDADVVRKADAKEKANDIYKQLMEGADFAELAKQHSEDPGSAENGGKLGRFGFGRMVPEFNDAVFAMKEGEISKPIKSQFGYHIIKLEAKYPQESYEETRENILNKLQQTGDFSETYATSIAQLKERNRVVPNQANYQLLMSEMEVLFPLDSVFIEKYQDDSRTLLTVMDQSYSIADFIDFMYKNRRSSTNLSTDFMQDKLNAYEYQMALQADDAELENRYPEFKNLMQEYRDGMLLFEVSNQEVWDKASTDTIGLKQFFNDNIEKYAWSEPRYKGYVVLAKDKATAKKMKKETKKMTPDVAARYLLDNYKVGEVSYVKLEKGLFTKGANPYVDQLIFKSGKAELPEGFGDFFLMGKKLAKYPESYTDVRGQVITDYQDYLEGKWLEELNNKYTVVINQGVVNRLK